MPTIDLALGIRRRPLTHARLRKLVSVIARRAVLLACIALVTYSAVHLLAALLAMVA